MEPAPRKEVSDYDGLSEAECCALEQKTTKEIIKFLQAEFSLRYPDLRDAEL